MVPMTVALPFSWSAAVNTSAALAVPPLTNIATGTVDQIVELKKEIKIIRRIKLKTIRK